MTLSLGTHRLGCGANPPPGDHRRGGQLCSEEHGAFPGAVGLCPQSLTPSEGGSKSAWSHWGWAGAGPRSCPAGPSAPSVCCRLPSHPDSDRPPVWSPLYLQVHLPLRPPLTESQCPPHPRMTGWGLGKGWGVRVSAPQRPGLSTHVACLWVSSGQTCLRLARYCFW